MNHSQSRFRMPGFFPAVCLGLAVCGLVACSRARNGLLAPEAKPQPTLQWMSLSWEKNLVFEQKFLRSFGERNHIQTQYVPNARLELYRQLLAAHSSRPDLLEVDVVWPAILADDLIDLRPYLEDGGRAFAPELLASYSVRGKLVALPLMVDVGLLYYRPALLHKYGFARPPKTWDELERMARRIQDGERRAGNKDFWGYVWQGALSEALTCNALEWQASAGGGNFLEPPGGVNVRNPALLAALKRAVSWLGAISPPAEYVYWEDDSMNLWDAGQTAFMRNWATGYGHIAEASLKDRRPVGVAPLPGGPGGQRQTLGGLGMGVSKYAANREFALQALLEITDEAHDLDRLRVAGSLPTHATVAERADVRALNPLLAVSAQLVKGIVPRPSTLAGARYDQVSLEYSKAINAVLRHKATPEAAMADLEKALVKLTGFSPVYHGNSRP